MNKKKKKKKKIKVEKNGLQHNTSLCKQHQLWSAGVSNKTWNSSNQHNQNNACRCYGKS